MPRHQRGHAANSQVDIAFPDAEAILLGDVSTLSHPADLEQPNRSPTKVQSVPLDSRAAVYLPDPTTFFRRRGQKHRNLKIYPILSINDGVAEGEGDLLLVISELRKQGHDAAGLAELSRLVRAKRRNPSVSPVTTSSCGCSKSIQAAEALRKRQVSGRTTKRSVQNERDSLVRKGYLDLPDGKPPSQGGVTRYRIRTESEVWEFFRSQNWTHWKRSGRGRKLLSFGEPTPGNGNE